MSRSGFVRRVEASPSRAETDLSEPIPPIGRDRFLEVELPEHFVVEVVMDNGGWRGGNSYLQEDCEQLDDGSYICGGRGGGSPQALRCIAHLPDSFIHLDGGGRPWRYRLAAVVDESTDAGHPPSASMFEVACECGTILAVFSRAVERPPVHCSRCGAHADSELASGEPWDGTDSTRQDPTCRSALPGHLRTDAPQDPGQPPNTSPRPRERLSWILRWLRTFGYRRTAGINGKASGAWQNAHLECRDVSL